MTNEALEDGKIQMQLPQNILDYCKRHNCNIQFNFNRTDGMNGYGAKWHNSIWIYRYAEWCERKSCNYHSLFNPYDKESRCNRHRIERDYTPIFYCEKLDGDLEKCFDDWLEKRGELK